MKYNQILWTAGTLSCQKNNVDGQQLTDSSPKTHDDRRSFVTSNPSSHAAASSTWPSSPVTGRETRVSRRAVLREPVLLPDARGRHLDRDRARGPRTAAQRTLCSWCCRPSAAEWSDQSRGWQIRTAQWCCKPYEPITRHHCSNLWQIMRTPQQLTTCLHWNTCIW